MTNDEIIRNFEKHADGSWVCLEATVIETASGPVPIKPGARFNFGETHQGLDVAEYLELLGAQFGS